MRSRHALTPERIRAVLAGHDKMARLARSRRGEVPLPLPSRIPDFDAGENLMHPVAPQLDAMFGEGTARQMLDHTRLTELLSILSRGTIEDQVARTRALDERMKEPAVAPRLRLWERVTEGLTRMVLGNPTEAKIRKLRSYDEAEVAAVLGMLDELEAVFPSEVARIRIRHVPGHRERLEAEVNAARAPAGSLGLTEARVRAVIGLVRELAPESKKVQMYLREPGIYWYWDLPVEKVFGPRVAGRIAKRGDDPQRFFEDLNWIRVISANIGRGETIAFRLAEGRIEEDPRAWKSPYRRNQAAEQRRSEARAEGAREVHEILARIDPEAEAAVHALLPEVQRVFREAAHAPEFPRA